MLVKKIFVLLSLVFYTNTNGNNLQNKLTWFDFADVKFTRVYNEEYGTFTQIPEFGNIIKSYEGKEITIKGYFLDITGNGALTMLSKRPMASCFFCGGSGPETVIELNFKEKPSFKTDQVIEITGTLKLNSNEIDRCSYILENVSGKIADF